MTLQPTLITKTLGALTVEGIPAMQDPDTGELFFTPDVVQVMWAVAHAQPAAPTEPDQRIFETLCTRVAEYKMKSPAPVTCMTVSQREYADMVDYHNEHRTHGFLAGMVLQTPYGYVTLVVRP